MRLAQDLRYALRSLEANKIFAIVAIATIAIGIGANTAMFSLVNGILLRPLPFTAPGELYTLWEYSPRFGTETASGPDFLDWRSQNSVFETVAAHTTTNANLSAGDRPERLQMTLVTPGWMEALRIQPVLGRTFAANEQGPGNRLVIIGDALWKSRFNSDPSIIGKSITLNEQTGTVIGVVPSGFDFPKGTQVWAAMPLDLAGMGRRSDFLEVIARAKPHVSAQQAQAEMETIAKRLEQQYPNSNSGMSVKVISLHEHLVGKTRPALIALWASVGLVLLIVCANVANLLLARGTARSKEFAIRIALGARNRVLVAQLLTESLLLAVLGGALGIFLANVSLEVIKRSAGSRIPRMDNVFIDHNVLLFALAATVLTGLLFGLGPALQITHSHLNESLKAGGRSSASTGPRKSLSGALVVSEVALSLMLLIGAGLMIRSIERLHRVDPGVRTDKITSFHVLLPGAKYKSADTVSAIKRLLEGLRATPGITSAAAINAVYVAEGSAILTFQIEGRSDPELQEADAHVRAGTPGLQETLGIPVISGRTFTDSDGAAKQVAVINQKFARMYFKGQDPIGHRVSFSSDEKGPKWAEIVGVVGDVKQNGLDADVYPEIMVPHAQRPTGGMTVLVRSPLDAASLTAIIRQQVQALDPGLPVFNIQSMQQIVSESFSDRRFNAYLFTSFACIALLLAAIGVYGVMAHGVTQRTAEFGVRMALGAQRSDILNLVVRQGMRMIVLGVVIGVAGALAISRFLSSMLFGVKATDPITYISLAVVLVIVALLACYIPARRATNVDPMVALRYE